MTSVSYFFSEEFWLREVGETSFIGSAEEEEVWLYEVLY
jgi:hypothetical protein